MAAISLLKTSYRSDISNVLHRRTENAMRKYFQKRIRAEREERELVSELVQVNLHSKIIVVSEISPTRESSPEFFRDDIIPDSPPQFP